MSLAAMSNILRTERNVLEQLLFKLTEEQRSFAAHDAWASAMAGQEVESVLEQLGRTELLRAIEVQAVGDQLGLIAAPTLRQLVEAAPSPWSTILRSHYEALRSLTTELARLAKLNRFRCHRDQEVLNAIEPLQRDMDLESRARVVSASLVDFLR